MAALQHQRRDHFDAALDDFLYGGIGGAQPECESLRLHRAEQLVHKPGHSVDLTFDDAGNPAEWSPGRLSSVAAAPRRSLSEPDDFAARGQKLPPDGHWSSRLVTALRARLISGCFAATVLSPRILLCALANK
jgi:hypothetical protein